MTVPRRDDDNGSIARWLGLPIDKWIGVFQSVGVPTLLLGFILYAAWSYLPPVVDGHLMLLRQTGNTLEKMDETLQQSNMVLGEIADIQRSTKTFMQEVQNCHEQQNQKLDLHTEKLEAIEKVVKPPQ